MVISSNNPIVEPPNSRITTSRYVGLPSTEISSMQTTWKMIQDLLEGTSAMRAATTQYLPKWEGEDEADYDTRVQHSFLFSGFRKVIRVLTSKPFARPVSWKNFPKQIEDLFDNVDLQGTSMQTFAQQLLWHLISDGIALAMVDMPITVDENNKSIFRNAKEQNDAGIRPYLVPIDVRNVLEAKFYPINGVSKLIRFRVQDDYYVEDELFKEVLVQRIRVYYPGYFEIWENNPHKEQSTAEPVYTLVQEGEMPFDEIPLVQIYAGRKNDFTQQPPLVEVAWKNVECWQDASNQSTTLAFARVPLIYVTGVTSLDGVVKVAPNAKIELTDPQAKVGIVEHQGHAIQAGERNAERIKLEMQAMGIQYISKITRTATERVMDDADEMSELKHWVLTLERGLHQCAEFMLKYLFPSKTLPPDATIDIYKEFEIGFFSAEDLKLLLEYQREGILDKESLLEESKRRRIISEKIDIPATVKKAEAEVRKEMEVIAEIEEEFKSDDPDYDIRDLKNKATADTEPKGDLRNVNKIQAKE